MCDGQKTAMAAMNLVRVDAAIALVSLELECISMLKEEQRMTLKAFLQGKNVFTLLLNDFSKSLIYQKKLSNHLPRFVKDTFFCRLNCWSYESKSQLF